nr:BPTI/Kunitz domain-containing protein-like [Drosophila takahashii]
MKFLLILASLIVYMGLAAAQNCQGRPNCRGGKDEGSPTRARGGPACTPQPNNNMWYYNERTNKCLKMSYKGCYGNRNRYCTLQSCEAKCPPRN